MNKLLIAIAVALVLGGGTYYFLSQKGSVPLPGTQSTIQNIRDAIAKSQPLRCEYPDKQGNRVTAYVKGERVRIVGYTSGANEPDQLLMRDNKLYIWDDETNKGTTISLDPQSAGARERKEGTIETLEEYKEDCRIENIADSLFEVPQNVAFTDISTQIPTSGFDSGKMKNNNPYSPPTSP